MDCLQAGMLGPYGNTWIRTPQFNRLAAGAWVADQCFAVRPEPAAALSAIWTDQLLRSCPWTLITDDPAAYAHDRAQAFAERILLEMPASTRAATEVESTQLAALFGKAVEWLQQTGFADSVWIHTRGMTGPWDAPLAMRNQYADEEDPTPPTFTAPPEHRLPADYDPDLLLGITHAYAGQVSLLDACLGVLLDAIDESGRADALALALVGLRGYPLGEHHRVGICDAALFRELVHVPLMIARPGSPERIGRSSRLLTHADLPRLLLDEVPIEPARDCLLLGSQRDRAIRTAAWYLRESGEADHLMRELYVKPDDLWEVNDVANRCPEIASGLSEALANPASPLPALLTTSVDD